MANPFNVAGESLVDQRARPVRLARVWFISYVVRLCFSTYVHLVLITRIDGLMRLLHPPVSLRLAGGMSRF